MTAGYVQHPRKFVAPLCRAVDDSDGVCMESGTLENDRQVSFDPDLKVRMTYLCRDPVRSV